MDLSDKLTRFSFDELLLAISFYFKTGSDKIIELCESRHETCNKVNVIQVFMSLIDKNDIDQLNLLVDFLRVYFRGRTWVRYKLTNRMSEELLLEEQYYQKLEFVRQLIFEKCRQFDENSIVSLLLLANRIFIKIS